MKQILFRGKRKNNQEWVEGDLMQHYIHHEGLTIVCGGCIYYEVDPSTVGQYTGVNDKNGKMIFEGDIMGRLFDDYNEDTIVVYHHGVLCAKPISKKYYRPLNIFNNCGWIPINEGSNYNFEIIGNIHDNPELLK